MNSALSPEYILRFCFFFLCNSITANTNEIVVTWSTMDNTDESVVEYGIHGYILRAVGKSEKFVDGGSAQHSQYIHKVGIFL